MALSLREYLLNTAQMSHDLGMTLSQIAMDKFETIADCVYHVLASGKGMYIDKDKSRVCGTQCSFATKDIGLPFRSDCMKNAILFKSFPNKPWFLHVCCIILYRTLWGK